MGVGVGDGVAVGVATGIVGSATLGTKLGVGAAVVATGDGLGDGEGDGDGVGPCSTTSADRPDALRLPSADARTSSDEPNTWPGFPSPASERSNETVPARSRPVAVSVNAPPGSIAVIVVR